MAQHLGASLLVHPKCPLCLHGWSGPSFCPSCRQELRLASTGLRGETPIPWRALGPYRHEFRKLLLQLRRQPNASVIRALAMELQQLLPGNQQNLRLCAIPPRLGHQPGVPQWLLRKLSWRSGLSSCDLLKRRRACIGQHHLNSLQRQQNLRNLFWAEPLKAPGATVLLLDDVLTTGATALAAAKALNQAGHRVAGLLCLASCP